MIKLFSSRFLTVSVFLFFAGIVISCNKDKDNASGKTELFSFGPTGTKHGDTLKFIGINLNKVTAIQFTGTNATVDQKDFKQQTSELILLLVPAAAEKGYVTLKTSDGDIVTKTQLNIGAEVSIASVTAEARPGENITITGNYLNWVDRVTFNSDKAVETFVSQSLTELVVKVPDDAQTGTLVLHYLGTDSADVETADTLHVKLPVSSSLSPNPVKHQTNLTITGTDLDLTKKIWFSGVAEAVTDFVSQSADQIVVNVPASTTTGPLKFEAASGVQTVSSADLDVILPAITGMSPNPIDPETDLTITGSNLDLVTSVSFIGVTNPVTTFVSQSADQIVVTVPAGVLKGKITLAVLNSTLKVSSDDNLVITGGLPPLADFDATGSIYTDAVQNGFQDWSYTNTHDFNSTDNVRQGNASIKAEYDAGNGYQGVTFHNSDGISTSGYTKLDFSIYGDAGLDGKKLNVVINGNYGGPYQVTIVGGEWTTFSLDLSSLGNPAAITEIVLQSAGWGGTLYIDHVGLR